MKYRLRRRKTDGKVERREGDVYININSTSCLTSEGGGESEDVRYDDTPRGPHADYYSVTCSRVLYIKIFV